MPETFDVRFWAARLSAEHHCAVFAVPPADLGGARAVWDPLTASLEVAEDLTPAEARVAGERLPELKALDPEDGRTVLLAGEDGTVVEVAAVRAARALCERARRLARVWRALVCR